MHVWLESLIRIVPFPNPSLIVVWHLPAQRIRLPPPTPRRTISLLSGAGSWLEKEG